MRGAAESTETAVATDSPARLPMSAPEDVAGVPTRNGSAASAASPASPAAATSVSVAAAFAELLSHGPSDPLTFEQALADLVRARRESRADLAAALSPVAVKGPTPQLIRDLPLATPLRQLHALAINAVWQPTPSRPYDGTFELAHLLRRLLLRLDRAPGMDPYALRSPADIITLRLAELAARIGDAGPAELVSTPTRPDGWIDPEVLVARVSAAEQAGWQPWPLDFDQALLRLPDTAGPATMRAAHDLSSPAGHRLAGWLRGGRPTLPSAREMTTVVEPRAGSPRVHPLATVDPPPPTAPAPTTLIHLLRRGWYPPGPLADGSCWTVCWPTLLPGHPGLIAVAAAWHPRHPDANGALCPTPVLTRLATPTPAASDLGPPPNTTPGPGLLTAVARTMTSRTPAKRADAAHALAALAVSGRLDPAAFAVALTRFAPRPDRQILRSAVPTLRLALAAASMNADGTALPAHTAAAANRAIGTAIVGWLPAILPPNVEQPLPYTSHLLNLAADALAAADAVRRVSLPRTRTNAAALRALNLLADRPSRSSVPDAARRVLAALTR